MLEHSQNFLVDPYLVKKLIDSLDIQLNDLIIDIGAGEGIITKHLSEKVNEQGKVIAIELDNELINTLDTKFLDNPKVEVLHQDILTYEYPNTPFKVVANIPFDITSDILNRLLDPNSQLIQANLIIQEDAANMYGGKDLGYDSTFKSLLAYPFFTFEILYRFHRSDFMPEPQINIVFLQINKRTEPLISLEQYDQYRDFLGFVSADRVGEGAWNKIFSTKQLQILQKQAGLTLGKGIKQQKPDSILKTFNTFITYVPNDKREKVHGAYTKKINADSKLSKIKRTRRDSSWSTK